MGKRIGIITFALLAAAVVLFAGFFVFTRNSTQEEPVSQISDKFDLDAQAVEDWSNVIAYVPLDDRTDNVDNVIYMAEASGYRIVMPPQDTYTTKLDGQEPNPDGTQHGDRESAFLWVQEMDKLGCNLFILSLDQLFSGGLVNSRSMDQNEDLVFEDGTQMSEAEAFDSYIAPLHSDPNNRIYLIDSVVRLASTVGYNGFDLEEYNALRAYGMVARPALTGDALTLDGVFASYPYAPNGTTSAKELVESAEDRQVLENDEIVQEYLNVRVRKLTLTDHVISSIKALNSDQFCLLIGIDDSSNTSNIQYNELSYIQKNLTGRMHLMAGLDSLGRILVGLIAQDQYHYQIPTSVTYFGGTENIPSSEYDRYTLRETVDLHLALYDMKLVEPADAQMQILVMTSPADKSRLTQYCDELLSTLKENEENNIPTVLIEASNNTYGDELESRLLNDIQIPRLLAFCGKYDQANVTGAGFAMGVSRYLYLKCSDNQSSPCDDAQAQQLANSLLLTLYIVHTRYDLNVYIRDLGYNYNNILATGKDAASIQKKLEKLAEPVCKMTEKSFAGATMITSLRDFAQTQISSISIGDICLPWNRTFEAAVSIDVNA